MLANQQTLTGNVRVHIAMVCGNFLQLLDKVLALLSCLFRHALFDGHVDCGYVSSTGQGNTACRSRREERMAGEETRHFRSGRKSPDRHDAPAHASEATERVSR